MGWSAPDVYSNPEKFGLELVLAAQDPDDCYRFDIFAVWRDASTGAYYYGSDSGCSCPTPFEDFTSLDALAPASSATELHRAVDAWGRPAWDGVTRAHEKIAELRFPVQGEVIADEDAELRAALTVAARNALTRAV